MTKEQLLAQWDKDFHRGMDLFHDGYEEPTSGKRSLQHGWQCAKAMSELKSKYLKESREIGFYDHV
jgi:hypothetical protein